MLKEIYHFLLHLRLHYQFFILSGGYLLGGLLADQMNAAQFWLQFINVHVLLFGGATAYNSYWDKDEGPIGGLKNPPKMTRWMHPVSLSLMAVGLIWAFQVSLYYVAFYTVSIVLFWLYSTPHARWKGDPHLSMVAIGVSTGTNSVLLGFWAAGGVFSLPVLAASIGAALIFVSLYPVSQIYQAAEDAKRGDLTFSMRYGLQRVQQFFLISFFTGLLILCVAMYIIYAIPALALFIIGLCSMFILLKFVNGLKGQESEYRNVMNIKLFASLGFVFFLILANGIRYEWIGQTVLRNYF